MLEGTESLAKGLKELENERVKLANELAKEDAGHGSKMAELQLAADKEAGQMEIAQHRMTAQEILGMELSFAEQEYNAKRQALQKELDAIQGNGAAIETRKREINNKLLELDKQFENQDQALRDQAAQKELASIQQSETRTEQAYARGFSQVLMGKQTFGKMMQGLDTQMAETAMQNAIMALAQQQWTDKASKLSSAEKAAGKAFAWAPNPLIGAPLAAAAFAAVLAFNEGGIVGGVGRGDIVPAMLTPGEAVLPKGLTEMLVNKAKFGDSGGSGETHIHNHEHHFHINAVDGASVRGMLEKHESEFTSHFKNTMRKMNR